MSLFFPTFSTAFPYFNDPPSSSPAFIRLASCFSLTLRHSLVLLYACSFDRSAFVSSFVDSLPLWLPLATQSTLPPALSDFLFRPPDGLPDSRSRLQLCVDFSSSAGFQSTFPAETLSLLSPSSSSSQSTPCVAAGFPRTPVLPLPLYQEMPRAQAGETKRDRQITKF